MDDPLRLLAATQHDVFSTADARELGHDDRSIAWHVRHRHWIRIRRGFFVFADVFSFSTAEERHLYVARAVIRSSREPVALSHITGALGLRVAMYQPDLSIVHLTRLDARHGVNEHGVMNHRGPLRIEDCIPIDDELLVAPAARTVFGAMCLGSLEQAVVIGDSALNSRVVDEDALGREADAWVRVARTRTARFAVTLLDAGAGSVGESIGRHRVFWRQGIPRPTTQREIRGPVGQRAFVDWYWEEAHLAGEFDGKGKYLRAAEDGENPGDVVFREKQREDWLRETDEVDAVCRMTWADLGRAQQTAARYRHAIERGRRLFAIAVRASAVTRGR